MSEPKWLTPDEMRARRMFISTSGDLLKAIEGDLAPFRLDLGDYQLLAILSESPEQQLRMCDLAEMLQLSRGGLTRRMEGVLLDPRSPRSLRISKLRQTRRRGRRIAA